MLNIDCLSKMSYVTCVVCLCSIVSIGNSIELQPIVDATSKQEPRSPPILVGDKLNLEFPKDSDVSTPILYGTDPKNTNLPPKHFPTKQDKVSTGRVIVSGSDLRNTEAKQSKEEGKLNLTNEKTSKETNMALLDNSTKSETPQEFVNKVKLEQPTGEQEDMIHSKYKGGQDVDEVKSEKKASEKDEKKSVVPKKDPKSEVSVSPSLDKNGPKLMNETKTKLGESMLESTSKMMAVSSSVLANTQPKKQGAIEPTKTVVSVLLTAVALLCFGAIGLLVWKRIAMRRFGRDVLINEDDFDEVADMHTFDRAQIQIT